MKPTFFRNACVSAAFAFSFFAGTSYAEGPQTMAAPAATAAAARVAGAAAVTARMDGPGETLEALNTNYRALYRQRTQQVLESLPLVLVVQNNMITAVRGHHRKLYAVPIQRYNEARAVVHAALGFHGLLSLQGQGAAGATAEPDTSVSGPAAGAMSTSHAQAHGAPGASTQALATLHAFQNDLDRTTQALRHSTLARNEKALAQEILTTLRTATEDSIRSGRLTAEDIAAALKTAEPKLSALAASIGEAHAQALQNALRRAQADATEAEWSQAVAVVTGPATPRRNNLETAATASVLGVEHLGTRIFYSENIFDVDGALSYLQTLVGDRELSQYVFGQPHRMWEDLFAPVSRGLVDQDFYTALPN